MGKSRTSRLQNARGAQENLWPKFFLERPVARHFVCYLISIWRAVCNLLKVQARHRAPLVGFALRRERFTSAVDASNEGAEELVESGRASNSSVQQRVCKGKTLKGILKRQSGGAYG
jgi:hypothetical protein